MDFEPNIVLKAGNITYGEYRTIEFIIIRYNHWMSAYVALYPQFSMSKESLEEIADKITLSNNVKPDIKDNSGRIEEWLEDYIDTCGTYETWLGWAYIQEKEINQRLHTMPIDVDKETIMKDIETAIDTILEKDNI